MLEAIFNDAITTVTVSGLTQWDYGRILYVKGLDLPNTFEVHFSDFLHPEAIVMKGKQEGSNFVCEVPNVLLESTHDIYGYIYLDDGKQGKTIREIILRVKKRPKPNDYVSENNASDVIDYVNEARRYASEAYVSEKNAKQSETTVKGLIKDAQAQVDRVDAIVENVPDFESYDTLAEHGQLLYGGLYENGMTYSGKASNKGIKLHSVQGKSEQVTTKGYQLFDASKLPTKSQGGATVTNNGDGSFTISGSGTISEKFISYYLTPIKLSEGTINIKYDELVTPYMYIDFHDENGIFVMDINNRYSNKVSKEITKELSDRIKTCNIYFLATVDEAIKTGTIKPMVYQDGDGTWEPFSGGKPSPSPEYPQEIESVEVKGVYSKNKNLFYLPKESYTEKGITVSKNVDGSITLNGTATDRFLIFLNNYDKGDEIHNKIRLKVGETYTNSIGTSLPNNVSLLIGMYAKDKKAYLGNLSRLVGSIQTNTFTVEKEHDFIQAYFEIIKGTTVSNLTIYPMLEKNSVKTDFKDSKLDTKQTNIVLHSLPNGVCDTYENGVVTRRVGVVEFDGSSDENLGISPSAENLVYLNIKDYIGTKENKIEIMCDKFQTVLPVVAVATMTEYQIKQSGLAGNKSIFAKMSSDITTVEQFRTWLSQNPIKIYYELATPVIEKVNVPTIPSYYPYTNVWTDNEIETEMSYELLANSDDSLKVEELEKRILALETKMIGD